MNPKTLRLDWIALCILFIGTALRLYQLGEFPFHPDEAIHAWFAHGFASYRYDPVYHGPLLYHLVAAVFGVFGANDFTARLVPALLGVLLLWLVMWPGRKFLGERAAIWSGALLCISPVVVTYSRRLLHDSLVLVLTLGAVYCFQTALEQPSTSRAGRFARIGLAAILALFLATKANAFFIAAMLLAFWIGRMLLKPREPFRCEWKAPAIAVLVAGVLWLALYRQDALSALPRMIEYWGGQQKAPRLPGPPDYYALLMLLYELPIVIAALWGAWCALTKRTPFTDLLLWWALSSLALYAIANEKVPWLLAHQILPMSLLAGYGLAQLEWNGFARKFALGLTLYISTVFLLRHVSATNLEKAADRHEPMLFAQTTNEYRDTLFAALESTRRAPEKDVWIAGSEQWPSAWYLREKSPLLGGSRASWFEVAPDESTLRVVLCSPEAWRDLQSAGRFRSWNFKICERYVWPRASWQALVPQRLAAFWWNREAKGQSKVLAEDSSLPAVIAWKNTPETP